MKSMDMNTQGKKMHAHPISEGVVQRSSETHPMRLKFNSPIEPLGLTYLVY